MTTGTSQADAEPTSTVQTPRFTLIEAGVDHTREEFEQDVRDGLRQSPKRLSCRFFYDAEGSRLFEAICQLPEYYPFRAEREILERRSAEIVERCEKPIDLVELGSGSAEKTTHLIDALLQAQGALQYVPIDISPTALEDSARALLADRPNLRVTGVAGEYNVGLEHLPDSDAERRLFLWLGSNIGNLRRPLARAFVERLRRRMDDRDRLLLGVDMRKDESIVQPAYDDSRGVTASFNRNLLARINRELDGDFDVESFVHEARWIDDEGRIEAHLRCTRAQTVRIGALDMEVEMAEGETIHTENSIKYSRQEIVELARHAGLEIVETWTDSNGFFSEVLLRPV